MKSFNVSIRGITPLLQHRFGEDAQQQSSARKIIVDRGTPREQAEKAVHRAPDGKFFFPSVALTRSIAEAGANHKLRGSRRSARYAVPASVFITEETTTLLNGDGKPAKDFEVDSRPVTIPATKGRIMRHRPRFDQWSASFVLRINDNILPPDFIKQLLDEAGMCVGLGDFRPQKSGPFGTFTVTEWKEIK